MIHRYKKVAIIYGGRGKRYAEALSDKLIQISQKERYPIQSTIINERILTKELLSAVIHLFKESEFCVAFLTKEDCCITNGSKVMRLRQNVVFELGMAFMELGRNRCILLSDFDIKSSDFDSPSDMNSLEILQFNPSNPESTLNDVVDKLLKMSQQSIVTGIDFDSIPKYDYLLTRSSYRVDYENIFSDSKFTLRTEGKNFIDDTLSYWIDECKSLSHYDEKCIFLLERIGFLPIFGNVNTAIDFLKEAELLIEDYQTSDIDYYASTELLNLTRDVIKCVIDYTILKMTNIPEYDKIRRYNRLLKKWLMKDITTDKAINPLISLVYYDYLGLTYLHIYLIKSDSNYLFNAKNSFLTALEYCKKIDTGMQIWKGFIHYNLARTYEYLNAPEDADSNYTIAYEIRCDWPKMAKNSITVRNALSSEYFIAKISYIDMRKRFKFLSFEEAQTEYNYIEKELDSYSDVDDRLDRLIYIRKLLNSRKINKPF